MMCRPMWSFSLMYGSHDMRHAGFSQVDGGQRDPREIGHHMHSERIRDKWFLLSHVSNGP